MTFDPRSIPVRFSTLKRFAQSAAHYRWACEHDVEQTLAMRLGTAAHAVLFGQPLALWTGKVRNGKAWDEFKLQHADHPIVNEREKAQADGMAAAVQAHPLASSLLFASGMKHERRIDWNRGGRACRSTPDAYGNGLIVDLKTSQSVEPGKFIRDHQWRGTHGQLAFYAQAIAAAKLGDVGELWIVGVESAPPHPVVCFPLTAQAWLIGEKLVSSWWSALEVAEASGEYPGYTQAPVPFDIEDNSVELTMGGEILEVA